MPEMTTIESHSDKALPHSIHSTIPIDSTAYITKLPTELLHQCLEYLIEPEITADELFVPNYTFYQRSKPCTRYHAAWALCLTCKFFSQLFRPFLYADLYLTMSTVCSKEAGASQQEEKARRKLDLFSRSIGEYPNLMRLCKALAVDLDTFSHLTQIGSGGVSFDNTRSLALSCWGSTLGDETLSNHGGESTGERAKSAWSLCRAALVQLPALQALNLEGGNVMFGHLTSFLGDLKSLKTLTLSGVVSPEPQNGRPCPAVLEQRAASDRAALPPPVSLEPRSRAGGQNQGQAAPVGGADTFQDKQGTATFTELRLQNPGFCSPYALKNFLRWPRSLEVFILDDIGMGDYDNDCLIDAGCLTYPWTFTLLTDALDYHKSTLRELRVGQITLQEDLYTLNLHKFPCVEILQVCTGLHQLPAAEHAGQQWITPKLRQLVLESSNNDSQGGKIYSFSPEDIDWLDKFGNCAERRRINEEVGLMEIQVLCAEHSQYSWWGSNPVNHPKALLSRAKEVLEKHHIKLLYSEDAFLP
jgi:hypothetical protein